MKKRKSKMNIRFSDFNEFDGAQKPNSIFLDNHSLVEASQNPCVIVDHHLCRNTEARTKLEGKANIIITSDNPGSNTLMLWQLYLENRLGDVILNSFDSDIYTHADADGFFSAYVFSRLSEKPQNDIDIRLAVTLGQAADMGDIFWDAKQTGAFLMGDPNSYQSDWAKMLRILKSYFKTHATYELNKPPSFMNEEKNEIRDEYALKSFTEMIEDCVQKRNPFGYLEYPEIYKYHEAYLSEVEKWKGRLYALPSMTFLSNLNDGNNPVKTKVIFLNSPFDSGRNMVYNAMRTFNKNEADIWGIYNHGLSKLSLHSHFYYSAFKLGQLLGGGGHKWGQEGTQDGGSLGSVKVKFSDLNNYIVQCSQGL